MTITKKALFFLGAAFFLTCSSTYIKVQAAQNMPDKSVQIGKKNYNASERFNTINAKQSRLDMEKQ